MARILPTLRRRIGSREPNRRTIIFTEGEVTELVYIRGIAQVSGNVLVSIQPQHGTPETLLKAARKFKRQENRRFDSASKKDTIWLVFDCDEHPNLSGVLNEAREAEIKVAFSNPCFELWLLLHFQDHDAPDNRHELQKKLEGACPSYSRGKKTVNFLELSDKIVDAQTRAKQMQQRRRDESNLFGNPYTDVNELIKGLA